MKAILGLLLVWLGASSIAAENVFVVLARTPTEGAYAVIERQSANALGKEWTNFVGRKNDLNRLVKLIGEGNHLALDVTIKMAGLSGGKFREICDAVGMQVKKEPEAILSAMRKHSISAGLAQTLFGCKPLDEFVDNFDAQLAETRLRMSAVAGVRNVLLADFRRIGLEHYRQTMETLDGAKRAMQP